MIAQVWECPKCKYQYESPIPSHWVSCGRKHNSARMVLIKGDPAPEKERKPRVKRPPVPVEDEIQSARPKASRASMDQLMASLKQVKGK